MQVAHAEMSSYGQDYLSWKSWGSDHFGKVDQKQIAYFEAEMERAGIKHAKDLKVLEIGFGNGSFLAYAKSKGWSVSGTEIIDDLIHIAKNQGYDARGDMESFDENCFDLIVAFDVLEHISSDRVVEFTRNVRLIAKPHAIFIARFPNGDSPFARALQNADLTHVDAIGSGKFRHLSKRVGADVVFIGKEAKPLSGVGVKVMIRRVLIIPIYFIINKVIEILFMPNWKGMEFCSPNLVGIMRFV